MNGPSPSFTVVARAMVSASTDRSCEWYYGLALRRLGGGTVSIDQTDGLPVELMDFSVAGSTADGQELNRAGGE